ncbi:H/ACA ribonucleoprotein complex subunit 2-like [Teratosphaeria destructans]|uniref:H/ACA ribonucleoprotein complex subunit 2-like n=1 Tax=Teratosphaeria destructans TaxID=418781 RepID=A0A9W7SUZ5_9PEZI|nr:H/ACA ribonucleoprotein complex subunit 2-like [Teratosphaeria destructans]
MAKDEVRDKKKEKKDKKRRASEVDGGLDDATTPVKKEKKSKKERKSVSGGDVVETTKVVEKVEVDEAGGDEETKVGAVAAQAMVVPFANPLCGDKEQKKVLKGVKKGAHLLLPPLILIWVRLTNSSMPFSVPTAAKSKALKRGVKECVKSIRKSPLANPTAAAATSAPGVVVLAADISPMDVISHIPVLCEDHGIPYVYVPSRAELGAAGSTKRPTSVVMVMPRAGKGGEEAAEGEWGVAFKELVGVAVKMGREVRV